MICLSVSRRAALIAACLPPWAAHAAQPTVEFADDPANTSLMRLATAWRVAAPAAGAPPDRIGVMEIDWAAARIRVLAEVPVPSRAHGLLALADGGFVAVANRPGRWLLRCDARGQPMQRIDVETERPARTFNGHVETSADGAWFFTTETDPNTDPLGGHGHISVRDARSLVRVAEFATAGRDPHQLLRAADGSLLVANGGIVRDREGRKIDGPLMAPSLVRIAPPAGQVIGQWRLDDPRLSIRHLAWARPRPATEGPEAPPLLGLALQAEHEREEQRRAAPTLALWDGESLRYATTDAGAAGYAGDIAAAPDGGFVISAQKARRGLWWQPARPERLALVAELTEPCGLAAAPGGVLISAGRGAARWHESAAPAMLPWPVALAPDNHWVVLRGA